MIYKIKSLLLSFGALSVLLVPAMIPATVAAADIPGNLCKGANLEVNSTTSCSDASGTQATSKVNDFIKNVINFISLVVGIVAVLMIIFGGFRYLTSGGDSNNVTAAKNTILYAIIGLIIVALAQFIVRFVLANVNIG